ncbi:hypothetical protein CHUAL_001073 [Chamberlinius hualienensis]
MEKDDAREESSVSVDGNVSEKNTAANNAETTLEKADDSMDNSLINLSETNCSQSKIECTVCHKSIEKQKLYQHPKLKVLLCKICFYNHRKCKAFFNEDGKPIACFMCGEGSKNDGKSSLMLCDGCDYGIHTSCVRKNVSADYYYQIQKAEKWECFACDPSPIEELKKICELYKDRVIVIKIPFMSPASKMAPELAADRSLENAFFSAKTLRDDIIKCRKKLSNKKDNDDIYEVYSELRRSLLNSNERNIKLLQVIEKMQDNLKKHLVNSPNVSIDNHSVELSGDQVNNREGEDSTKRIVENVTSKATAKNEKVGQQLNHRECEDDTKRNDENEKIKTTEKKENSTNGQSRNCDGEDSSKCTEKKVKRKSTESKETSVNETAEDVARVKQKKLDISNTSNAVEKEKADSDDNLDLSSSVDDQINEKSAKKLKNKRNSDLDASVSDDKEEYFSDFEFNPSGMNDLLTSDGEIGDKSSEKLPSADKNLSKDLLTSDGEMGDKSSEKLPSADKNLSKDLLMGDNAENSSSPLSSHDNQFELPKVGKDSDHEHSKSPILGLKSSPKEKFTKDDTKSTASNSNNEKSNLPLLRLSLSKKIKNSEDVVPTIRKKSTANRSLLFDSDSSSGKNENESKPEGETNNKSDDEDDEYVEQRKKLIQLLDESDSDELKGVDGAKRPRVNQGKTKQLNPETSRFKKLKTPVNDDKSGDEEIKTKVERKKQDKPISTETSHSRKLKKLLNDDNSDEEKIKTKVERKKPEKPTVLSTLDEEDDPKLRMNVEVSVKRFTENEVNFVLKSGVNAWRKYQRRLKTKLDSSEEEFLKMCDISRIGKKKKHKSSRQSEKTLQLTEEKGDRSSIKIKSSVSKETKDDIALAAINSSDSEEVEDVDNNESKKKSSLLSSESEPEFKSANELDRDRLLKELLTSSSDSSDDDDDKILDEEKKKRIKNSTKTSEQTKVKEEKSEKANDSEDDFVPARRTKITRSKSSKHIISDSDSNDSVIGFKRNAGGKSKDSDADENSSSSETSTTSKKRKFEDGKSSKKKRRRRIKVASSSDDSSVEELSGSENNSATPGSKGRKNIRKMISDRKLHLDTKMAAKEEDERRKRVSELQKLYNEVQKNDDVSGAKITTKLVLAKDPNTNEILEINESLVCKLKPHQVEGVRYMWECVGESLERLDTTSGSGCILAHCMGLGKTLQVITFLHTILTRKKEFPNTALVVSPLNTVLNWYRECEMWLEDILPSILVMEMSSVRQNRDRLQVLRNWSKNGGILIMGYDNFRNLVKENNKKTPKFFRDQFHSILLDPGPDVVVCDEGHILKNSNNGISKAMSRINTKRRIILTGTPLQNNLSEYHCMVSFVKPKLLGTMKEFQNRFVNPINNGQHNDSTLSDVRLMKHRAHVLFNLLGGCVQRKDYNVLTPFLPPKHEYVLSIGLTDIQRKLYAYYLANLCIRTANGKGQLFSDYQNLMRIWTHPRVIRLAEIRQEEKAIYDSEDSFIDDDSESSNPPSNESIVLSDSDGPGTSSKKKKEDSDTEVVVAKWTTRSRRAKLDALGVKVEEEVKEEESKVEPIETWWTPFVSEEDAKKVELSGKMMVLFDILKQSEDIGDKVLIFSQSLLSLDFIETIINGTEDITVGDELSSVGKMVREVDYFRLDGSTNASDRDKFIERFNNKDNLKYKISHLVICSVS